MDSIFVFNISCPKPIVNSETEKNRIFLNKIAFYKMMGIIFLFQLKIGNLFEIEVLI